MSSPSSPTLICEVNSRRAERRIALLVLAATAVVPFLLQASGPAAGALFCAAGLLAWSGLRRAGWIGAGRRIVALSWLADGRWLLTDERNASVAARLRSDARAGSRWVWLRWDTEVPQPRRKRSMLLFAGDLPPPDLRRLIVRLRIEGAARAVAPGMQPP